MTDDSHRRSDNMRRVLMLAYVFPPFWSVGGSIRVVKFIKYLPALGWLPSVLTINDQKEYETMRKVGSDTLLPDIPQQVKIYRTFAGEPSLEFLEKEKRFGQRNWLAAVIVKVMSAGTLLGISKPLAGSISCLVAFRSEARTANHKERRKQCHFRHLSAVFCCASWHVPQNVDGETAYLGLSRRLD